MDQNALVADADADEIDNWILRLCAIDNCRTLMMLWLHKSKTQILLPFVDIFLVGVIVGHYMIEHVYELERWIISFFVYFKNIESIFCTETNLV